MRKILYEGSKSEIIVKKSRFISTSFRVNDTNEANEILLRVRKEYWDATHNCYAYRINNNNKKCSDDGEPAKTAGYPILEVIDSRGIDNCLIIVTRYFGGTLLGTGGLVRAYTDASIEVLNTSNIIEIKKGYRARVICTYDEYGTVNYNMNIMGVYIKNVEFTDKVYMDIYVNDDIKNKFNKKMQELLRNNTPIEYLYEKDISLVCGEMLEFD